MKQAFLLILALCARTAVSQQVLLDYNAPPSFDSFGTASVVTVYEDIAEPATVYFARVFDGMNGGDPKITEVVKLDISTGQTLDTKVMNGVDLQTIEPFSSTSLLSSRSASSSNMIDIVNKPSLATTPLFSTSERIDFVGTLPDSENALVQTYAIGGAGTSELQVVLPGGALKWSTTVSNTSIPAPVISQDGTSILVLDTQLSGEIKRLSLETGAVIETAPVPPAFLAQSGLPFLSSQGSSTHGYVYALASTQNNATTNEDYWVMTRFNDNDLSDQTRIILPNDWALTNLAHISPDGSILFAYGTDKLSAYDLTKGERAVLLWTVGANMYGFGESGAIYASQTQLINLESDPTDPDQNSLLVFRDSATGQLEGMYRIVSFGVNSFYVNEDASRIYLKGFVSPRMVVLSNPRNPVEPPGPTSAGAAVSMAFWTMAAVVSGLLLVI